MAMRIESLADIVETGEAEACEERHGLVAYCPHPFENSFAIYVGVIERSVQVIDYREPFGGDSGSFHRPHTGQLTLVALSKIVQVRQSASERQILSRLCFRSGVRSRARSDFLGPGIFSVFTARSVGSGVVCSHSLRGAHRGLVNGHSAISSP
jgi:hypothetical protein